tara:strand:+ start:295 stop:1035 length:741 start_codon:yes stop_codon:yes gene_type:complete
MHGFIFFILFSFLNANSIIVIDAETEKPIKNVNVFVGKIGTTTDSYGMCSIEIFKKDDVITFSMIGYEPVKLSCSKITKSVYLKKQSISMEPISVIGRNKKSKKSYTRLEKNVRKVYPYALKVSDLLSEYSSIIHGLDQYSGLVKYQKKRSIFSKIEDDLISKYGYSIKKLRKSQGRILIKLIDRQTDKTSFQVIKEFRNIFSAGFWQLTARVFGHNLLSEYNPNNGEDRIIENIINKIENEKRKS